MKNDLLKNINFNEYQYDDLDCASLPMFSGGFVNFGYWKNLQYKNQKIISRETRKSSSINLYKKALEFVGIEKSHTILEAGCGSGVGIPIIAESSPRKIIGLDYFSSQIERAKARNKNFINSNILELINAPAENTGLMTESIDRIISIESIQNFYCANSFIKESARLLKKNGRAIILTVFALSKENAKKINSLKPVGIKRTDHIMPIDEVINYSIPHFNINCIRIGENVFEGYNNYILGLDINHNELWSSNFYNSFKNGEIDYFIVILDKC